MSTAAVIDLARLTPEQLAERLRKLLQARLLRQVAPILRAAYRKNGGEFIYAIQAGPHGPVKVGKSINVAERYRTLQQGCPHTLIGLAAWPALPGEEAYWHARFRHLRIRGEWFEPDPELIADVRFAGGIYCDWPKEVAP